MRPLHIAVTGLNANDNPGPGISVIRALRASPDFRGRIIGLAYDALEPGIYARELVDDVFLIPYPSQGTDALEARLQTIDAQVGLDVIIPTLDAELDAFIALGPHLRSLGIGTFLPTRPQLRVRAKTHLAELGREIGLRVPTTKVLTSLADLYRVHEEIGTGRGHQKPIPYPFFVKGPFYGATLVRGIDEATKAFATAEATWGLPIIVQASVVGEEFDVVAVGDGRGGLVGAVPMKKLSLTDKGKGWAGITVKDPALLDAAARFVAKTRWRGPCEVEVIKDRAGEIHLLEVNPRFPAWVYLSAGAGHNLPWAVACLAAGRPVTLGEYRVGTMFVRISIDQIADLGAFRQLAEGGHLTTHTAPASFGRTHERTAV